MFHTFGNSNTLHLPASRKGRVFNNLDRIGHHHRKQFVIATESTGTNGTYEVAAATEFNSFGHKDNVLVKIRLNRTRLLLKIGNLAKLIFLRYYIVAYIIYNKIMRKEKLRKQQRKNRKQKSFFHTH